MLSEISKKRVEQKMLIASCSTLFNLNSYLQIVDTFQSATYTKITSPDFGMKLFAHQLMANHHLASVHQ